MFDFYRNKALNTLDKFQEEQHAVKPDYSRHQFGFALGGPIVKEKVFFFTDYEGFRKQQGTVTSVNTVPTLAERQGNFSAVRPIYDPASVTATPGTPSGYTRTEFPGDIIPASRFDSVTSRLIQAYPLPTGPGLVNNQFTNPVLGQNYDQGDARVDHGRKLTRKKDEVGFFYCPNFFSTSTGYRLSLERQDHEPAAHETGYGVIFIQRVLGTGDDATGRVASLIGEGYHILVIMLRIADAVPASSVTLASTRVAPEA